MSQLSKSTRIMNPSTRIINLSSPPPPLETKDHARILVNNFLQDNSTWALDSIYSYCLKYYADYGVTKQLLASCIHSYIMGK